MLAVAPLLQTGIKKMKARLQNRQGPPLTQGYDDLAKLLRKEVIRSETASWVYVAGPRVYFAAASPPRRSCRWCSPRRLSKRRAESCCWWEPWRWALRARHRRVGHRQSIRRHGPSRDMTIAALAEPALMLGLFTSALAAGSMNVGVLVRTLVQEGVTLHPADILAFAGLFMIVIAETGRIPVDNPATHLELTMIHEAMVLEYAGPDLALVEWASAVKELLYSPYWWISSCRWASRPAPRRAVVLVAIAAWIGKVLVLALAVTVVESTNAKLRLFRVPELVSISLGLGFLALAIRFL